MRCIKCKEKINDGASFCHICSHYQSSWRNSVRYLASVVGVVTLIGSGIAFVATKIPELVDSYFPNKNISVVSFSTLSNSSFHNSSDGPIFLEYYQIINKFTSQTTPIQLTVERGSAISIPEKSKFPEEKKDPIIFIRRKEEDKWSEDKWSDIIHQNCVEVGYFNIDNIGLSQLREAYGALLAEYKSSATVHYVYLESGEKLTLSIPVKGIPYNPINCDAESVESINQEQNDLGEIPSSVD